MTREQNGTLVLRDADGAYYVLTAELLAAARVPAECQAELEQRLGDADSTGFSFTQLTMLPPPSGSGFGNVSSGTEATMKGPGLEPRRP